ncbi:MAG: F0F1 ATP synthase subunit A [Candidatus Omnitrophota bacterium]
MAEAHVAAPELPNIVSLVAHRFPSSGFSKFLLLWENVIFSLIIVGVISLVVYRAARKRTLIPGRLQCAVELIVGTLDEFVCSILGAKGRTYVPFIGTLFIYIACMNLLGLVPFMKSPTASLSTTAALAICVFVYVQYSSMRELGFIGYVDHLMGNPRGIIAFSVVVPLFMLVLHIISEVIRPVSLALRLRSNVWGDDMLIAMLSGLGLKGLPILLFSTLLVLVASLVQAFVFSLLTTVYFALFLVHEE